MIQSPNWVWFVWFSQCTLRCFLPVYPIEVYFESFRGILLLCQCHPWQIHPRSWIVRWRSYLPLLVQLHSFVAIEDRCRSPKGQQCFTCNSATRKMPCFWRCKMVGDRVLGLFNAALRQGFTSVSYDMESALKFATQSNQGRQGNLKARFFPVIHGPRFSVFPRKETWRDDVFATTGQPNDHCWLSRSGKLFRALQIGMTWTLQYFLHRRPIEIGKQWQECHSGRSIAKLSARKEEVEVLFPKDTYFEARCNLSINIFSGHYASHRWHFFCQNPRHNCSNSLAWETTSASPIFFSQFGDPF